MKDNLFYAAVGIVIGVAVIGLAKLIAPDPPIIEPIPTSCRILEYDHAYFENHRVKLCTDGMQPGAVPSELIYRKRADQPPIVVCRFAGPIPDPLPQFITGTCRGMTDGAVLITDCRSSP